MWIIYIVIWIPQVTSPLRSEMHPTKLPPSQQLDLCYHTAAKVVKTFLSLSFYQSLSLSSSPSLSLSLCLSFQVMSPSLPAAGSALSDCSRAVKSEQQLERTKDSQLCRIGNTFCTSLQLWLWTPHNICCTLFIIYNFAQLCTTLHKCTLCKSRSAVQIGQNFQRTQLSLELQPRSDNAAGCFLKREI